MTTMKMTMMTSHNQYLHHHPITITIIIAIIITVNDGRYVACALPWDGRVSVIQTFCRSKRRYAQNEHLQCIAIGALYMYTQNQSTMGALCKYTETHIIFTGVFHVVSRTPQKVYSPEENKKLMLG